MIQTQTLNTNQLLQPPSLSPLSLSYEIAQMLLKGNPAELSLTTQMPVLSANT